MGTSIPNYNVSEKYKTIWLAPERTGSRKVSEILTFYDFKRNNSPVFNFGIYNFSHVIPTDSRYLDYDIICNTRNPYSRVYSLFKNFYSKFNEKNKSNFKKYLIEDLPNGQMVPMVVNPILSRVPDHIIRLEYMTEDLLKLPFIYDVLNEKQIKLLTQHGKEIDEWQPFYDQESKDIVYEYCKSQFILGGYEK